MTMSSRLARRVGVSIQSRLVHVDLISSGFGEELLGFRLRQVLPVMPQRYS